MIYETSWIFLRLEIKAGSSPFAYTCVIFLKITKYREIFVVERDSSNVEIHIGNKKNIKHRGSKIVEICLYDHPMWELLEKIPSSGNRHG